MILCEKSRMIIQSSIKNFLLSKNNKGKDHYVTHTQGSAIYLLKCKTVTIWLAPPDAEICLEAPKIYFEENSEIKTAYLDPTSWVLKNDTKTIPCSDILQYKLGVLTLDYNIEWYCRNSAGGWSSECIKPDEINPMQPTKIYETKILQINFFYCDLL